MSSSIKASPPGQFRNGVFERNDVAAIGHLGTAWEVIACPAHSWNKIKFANGVFVAVGSGNGGDLNDIMISTDNGDSWQTKTPADKQFFDVAYGNGTWVTVGEWASCAISTDNGATWVGQSMGVGTTHYHGLVFDESSGLFIAIASNGYPSQIRTSPDGITWTARSTQNDVEWWSIDAMNGRIAAVGYQSQFACISDDGVNFYNGTEHNNNNWRDIANDGSQFVKVGNSGGQRIFHSPDGHNWTAASSHNVSGGFHGVTYANGIWMACGTALQTSPDGDIWTTQTYPAVGNRYKIAYGNGVWIGVGTDAQALRSTA